MPFSFVNRNHSAYLEAWEPWASWKTLFALQMNKLTADKKKTLGTDTSRNFISSKVSTKNHSIHKSKLALYVFHLPVLN